MSYLPDDWTRLKEVFDGARALPPDARPVFLTGACRGDQALRLEVERLLASHEAAASFLETPAMLVEDTARCDNAGRAATRRVPDRAADRRGRHGRGVSRRRHATEPSGRDQASVVRAGGLISAPPLPAGSEDGVGAQSSAHPHRARGRRNSTAASIWSPSSSMAARSRSGPGASRARRARSWSCWSGWPTGWRRRTRQVFCTATSNRKTSWSRRVATRSWRTSGWRSWKSRATPAAATHTVTAGETRPGVVIGTVAYMSPEQASGKPLDARSDIFSFGVVLYELLAGRRPFTGATDLELLQTVIHGAPQPLGEHIPIALRMAVDKALEKDPAERYQTMRDLVVDLRRVARQSEAVSAVSGRALHPPSRLWRRLAPFALVGAALAALLAYWLVWSGRSTAEISSQWSFSQLTDEPGQELYPSLSPDGRSLVYASQASGNWDIYFQRVGGKTALNLTKDSAADDTQPAFSPDGERIAFRSERDGGGLFVMGATGENARRLSDRGFHPSWSPDAKEIAAGTADFPNPESLSSLGQLIVVEVATGRTRVISEAQDALPAPLVTPWAPDCVLGQAAGSRHSETSGPWRHPAAQQCQSPTTPPPTGTRSGHRTGGRCFSPAIGAEA